MSDKYVCENCGYSTNWSKADYRERGNPVCPDCDAEMVLEEPSVMPLTEAPENGIRLIGHVGVDSGQVIITDPCYLKGFESNEFTADEKAVKAMQKSGKFPYSYEGACARTLAPSQGGEIGLGEQGVVSSSGFGDGEYPVYAEFHEGRVKALRIVFF